MVSYKFEENISSLKVARKQDLKVSFSIYSLIKFNNFPVDYVFKFKEYASVLKVYETVKNRVTEIQYKIKHHKFLKRTLYFYIP